jgi:transposase, IS30 family
MARQDELAKRLKMRVYFCDPHSPWQRPSNENIDGLLRQYLPKGINLSIYSQSDLNARHRLCLGFQSPEEVFNKEILKLHRTLQM